VICFPFFCMQPDSPRKERYTIHRREVNRNWWLPTTYSSRVLYSLLLKESRTSNSNTIFNLGLWNFIGTSPKQRPFLGFSVFSLVINYILYLFIKFMSDIFNASEVSGYTYTAYVKVRVYLRFRGNFESFYVALYRRRSSPVTAPVWPRGFQEI